MHGATRRGIPVLWHHQRYGRVEQRSCSQVQLRNGVKTNAKSAARKCKAASDSPQFTGVTVADTDGDAEKVVVTDTETVYDALNVAEGDVVTVSEGDVEVVTDTDADVEYVVVTEGDVDREVVVEVVAVSEVVYVAVTDVVVDTVSEGVYVVD